MLCVVLLVTKVLNIFSPILTVTHTHTHAYTSYFTTQTFSTDSVVNGLEVGVTCEGKSVLSVFKLKRTILLYHLQHLPPILSTTLHNSICIAHSFIPPFLLSFISTHSGNVNQLTTSICETKWTANLSPRNLTSAVLEIANAQNSNFEVCNTLPEQKGADVIDNH